MRLYLRESQPPRQIAGSRAWFVVLAQRGFQVTAALGFFGVCLTGYLFRPSDLPGLLVLPMCGHVMIATGRIISISDTGSIRDKSSENDYYNIERVEYEFADSTGRSRVGYGYRAAMTGATAQRFGIGARLSVGYCRDRPWASEIDGTTPTMHLAPGPIGAVMASCLIGAWISFVVYVRRGRAWVLWLRQGRCAAGAKPVVSFRPKSPLDGNVYTMAVAYKDAEGQLQICRVHTVNPEVLLEIERPIVLFRDPQDGAQEAILADVIPGMDAMESIDREEVAPRKIGLKYGLFPALFVVSQLVYVLASLFSLMVGMAVW